ncbi:symmetrical bis(5'-nucleosyl)-tetraphosphatase [Pseudoalteromonas sp. YIC-827]|uniref:bis(5'-nucleosyl)-tetraphosphatase (symmetrical) n=1 Tax=Pseudoalteromonas qingdaonensis TaxID=3131913 RepID=A0ABU9MSR7_9GAMM
MTQYAVGDIQGCYQELDALLKRIDFNPSKDHLYCVGDIVARGSDSLACLRRLQAMEHAVSITLGNHDLHLLATVALGKEANPKDKLAALLTAPDCPQLLAFLQRQPLAIWLEKRRMLISHAGLSPQWSLSQALQQARFAEQCYQGEDAAYYFARMYQNAPSQWHEAQSKVEKFIYTINAFTRMRFVNKQGALNLSDKGAPNQNGPLIPWFNHPNRGGEDFDIVFGHWAALEGHTGIAHIHALDTGCVWGGSMTAMNLKNKNTVSIPAYLSS